MQDGPKVVWSIPYVYVYLFKVQSRILLFMAFSKVSWRPDCIFEIHQLWQSGCIPITAAALHLNLKS